jgi:hypothetical protein
MISERELQPSRGSGAIAVADSTAGREASSGSGAPLYVRYRPELTLLYQIVDEYYPASKAHAAARSPNTRAKLTRFHGMIAPNDECSNPTGGASAECPLRRISDVSKVWLLSTGMCWLLTLARATTESSQTPSR